MSSVTKALAAVADGDWDDAANAARLASERAPSSFLARALAVYLGDLPSPGVYDEPSAFEAFIDNGSNPELYRRTIDALAAVHTKHRPASVLDIGCGEGRVSAAVLSPATAQIDLVEPATALLDTAVAQLAKAGPAGTDVAAHPVGVADFLAGLDDHTSWDLVQATYALHTTEPADRPHLLAELARRSRRIAIAEFDVPAFADRSPGHIAYLADRYEHGVREHQDQPEVITGFVLPVLVGQLDPARPRYTFEQPVDRTPTPKRLRAHHPPTPPLLVGTRRAHHRPPPCKGRRGPHRGLTRHELAPSASKPTATARAPTAATRPLPRTADRVTTRPHRARPWPTPAKKPLRHHQQHPTWPGCPA